MLRVFTWILRKPGLIRPHVIAKDISNLNFKKMKEMGMEKIIFDKENTLTGKRKPFFLNAKIKKSFVKAKAVFGKDNTMVVSNMGRNRYRGSRRWFDRELKEVKFFHRTSHTVRKPFNFNKIKNLAKKRYNYDLGNPEKMVMVGDRLTSDVMFGNINRMATVYVKPFSLLDKGKPIY